VIIKQETKQKWNETQQKRNETKRDTTETKPKKSSINKKTNFFFLHEITIYKMPVADWKTFKIYGKIWLWKKIIIRISYKKAHHFPASCVLCKFLRFIEKKKYIWLIPNPLSRKRRSTVTPWSSIRWKPTSWSDLRVAHETTQSTPLDIYLWS
jgi:hypothetical protein